MAARNTPATGPKSDKVWRDAIMRAVKRRDKKDDPQALEKLADKLVDVALTGDIPAMKEIGDRLDGKPVQGIAGSDGGDLVVKVLTGIARD